MFWDKKKDIKDLPKLGFSQNTEESLYVFRVLLEGQVIFKWPSGPDEGSQVLFQGKMVLCIWSWVSVVPPCKILSQVGVYLVTRSDIRLGVNAISRL